MTDVHSKLSMVRGIALEDEEGMGALTLGGFLEEITALYGSREAAVLHSEQDPERWTYNELWQLSVAVARTLLARGVGKGPRVGILMTNRLEFLSATFGTALAGGIATTMSTFSTPAEMEVLLENSGCSVLLLERHILKRDFADMLCE